MCFQFNVDIIVDIPISTRMGTDTEYGDSLQKSLVTTRLGNKFNQGFEVSSLVSEYPCHEVNFYATATTTDGEISKAQFIL